MNPPPNPAEFHYACAHNEVQVLRDLLIEVGTGTEILNKALKVREIMTMVDVGCARRPMISKKFT